MLKALKLIPEILENLRIEIILTQYVNRFFLLKARRELTGLYLVDTWRILERLIRDECTANRRFNIIEFLLELQPTSGNLSLVRDYSEIEISGCSLNVYIHSAYIYICRTINSGQATHAHAWTAWINAYPHRYRGTNGFRELVSGEMNLVNQFQRTEQSSLTWNVREGAPFGCSHRRGSENDSRGNVTIAFYAARTRWESGPRPGGPSSPLSLAHERTCDRLYGF